MKNKIAVVSIIVFALLTIVLLLFSNSKSAEQELEEEGYTTTEEDAFYKKIVSDNTLDDYYNDISNNTDSYYEEYNFTKESNDFIELKMIYNSGTSSVLNISSDLKTQEINYNYEVTKGKARLLIEGNSFNNYECNVVVKNNIVDTAITKYCDQVVEEVNKFIIKREEFIKNKKISDLVNKPITQYVEE